jgi:hypothetical protein
VRDKVLEGYTPVVFWDEFDSGEYKWLQYLLAPMQDGTFQDGQLTHPVGKSIFVFAGGTSCDFDHFGPPEKPKWKEDEEQLKARHDFVMKKGPDFKSRLAGYFDVIGPNPRQKYNDATAMEGLNPWEDDPEDLAFPVRRSILLRSLLGLVKNKDEDRENEHLEIDHGLLMALLKVKHYKNGARSMEKLVTQMKDRGELPLRRSHLPPDNLLELYVENVREFHSLIHSSYEFLAQAEVIAKAIHDYWYAHITQERRDRGGPYCMPYDQLDDKCKATNIAAAMRISEILGLIGYELKKGTATANEETLVKQKLLEKIDLLAEAEHLGWDEQSHLDDWVYGPKFDEEKKIHNLLVSYDELPEVEKKKDRAAVMNYPDNVRLAGFKIVQCKTEDAGT